MLWWVIFQSQISPLLPSKNFEGEKAIWLDKSWNSLKMSNYSNLYVTSHSLLQKKWQDVSKSKRKTSHDIPLFQILSYCVKVNDQLHIPLNPLSHFLFNQICCGFLPFFFFFPFVAIYFWKHSRLYSFLEHWPLSIHILLLLWS